MVLVDTSIWIRFLAGKEPYASELDRLLANDQVRGHELVYGELLIGQRGGRTRVLANYAQIEHLASVSHAEVVTFVTRRRLTGRGLGWIDAHLLASALVADASLFTADTALAAVAQELGFAHAHR